MSEPDSSSQEQSPEGVSSQQNETPGVDEQFCTSCGAVIKEEASICPECGVDQGATDSGQTEGGRATSGRSRSEFEQRISDLEVEGWEVKNRANDKAIMINRKTGGLIAHIVIFILVGWWTLGIANGIYFAYKYFADVDKQVIRKE